MPTKPNNGKNAVLGEGTTIIERRVKLGDLVIYNWSGERPVPGQGVVFDPLKHPQYDRGTPDPTLNYVPAIITGVEDAERGIVDLFVMGTGDHFHEKGVSWGTEVGQWDWPA